ncbi:unnamed protein product, partial [Nesidiocoris tenuis]
MGELCGRIQPNRCPISRLSKNAPVDDSKLGHLFSKNIVKITSKYQSTDGTVCRSSWAVEVKTLENFLSSEPATGRRFDFLNPFARYCALCKQNCPRLFAMDTDRSRFFRKKKKTDLPKR